MLSIQNGKYYNLGETGGVIWEHLRQAICVSRLIELLVAEYNVDPSEGQEQVVQFLEMLLNENLIDSNLL